MTDQRVYGRLTPDPERLRLLEAVAEAARAHALLVAEDKGLGGMAFAAFVAMFSPTSSWRILLEALLALEVYDDEGTTNQR